MGGVTGLLNRLKINRKVYFFFKFELKIYFKDFLFYFLRKE